MAARPEPTLTGNVNVFISNAYAQAAAGAEPNSWLTLLPMVLMFVVLWFVMIRPQMKKAKEHKAMVEALQKGDEVVTQAGILGKVTKVGDTNISLEISEGVEIQMQRMSVALVLPKGTIK